MGARAAPARGARVEAHVRFWHTTVGKKAVMAVTGLLMVGYVVVHLLGNLQVFAGRERVNAYALFLKSEPVLLWGVRIVLLVSLVLHVAAAVQLAALRREARPAAYAEKRPTVSTWASRAMLVTGAGTLAFVVYHLLHLTWGVVHPAFSHEDVYGNVVVGFLSLPVAAAYAVGLFFVGAHIYHGGGAMFRTVGVSNPRHAGGLQRAAAVAAVVLALGYVSMPIAVQLGWVRP